MSIPSWGWTRNKQKHKLNHVPGLTHGLDQKSEPGHIDRGFLVYDTGLAASADLILDETIYEIKTTKDLRHHNEHISQLFAYYLISQAPVRKPRPLNINELAIYYARHGALVKQPIADLAQFPITHLKRVAFDFMVEFQFSRSMTVASEVSAKEIDKLHDLSFNDTLKSLHPRPAWLLPIIEKQQKTGAANFHLGARRPPVKRIVVPANFLLDQE